MRLLRFIRRVMQTVRGYFLYIDDLRTYKTMLKSSSTESQNCFDVINRNLYPKYTDRWAQNGGGIDSSYFLSTLWIARDVIDRKPAEHYDIASTIDHFVSKLLAARIHTTIIDIRPFAHDLDYCSFIQANAMDLSSISDESVMSLSCIYAMEHYGLGRYGDPIDPDGWLKGLQEMQRIVKNGGLLYLATSVGEKDLLRFNAHRVFHPYTIIRSLSHMRLLHFLYCSDWKMIETDTNEVTSSFDVGTNETCGIFVFEKI